MGWLDFFFRPLSPDRYAEAMVRELKRQGDQRTWRYDAAQFRLVAPSGRGGATRDPVCWNLGNFYGEYRALPRTERDGHLKATVARILSIPADAPDDFETVRPHLRPKLWPRAGLENARLQARLDVERPADQPPACAPLEIGEHLRGGLVYDMPTAVMSLSDDHLKTWGVSFYEAYEIAVRNLSEEGATVAQMGEGLYAFLSGDSYDASRLLAQPILEQLTLKGRPIAAAPVRDLLLIGGEDDDGALETMATMIEKVANEPRGLSPIPIVFDGEEWLDWSPPREKAYAARFDEFRLRFLWTEYQEQKKLLEAFYQKAGIDRFVASYTVVENAKLCERFSYAVWAEGVETLLPRVERVVLASGGESDKKPLFVKWDALQRVVGERLNDAGLYPARYLADFFPTEEEMKAMAVEGE